MIISCPARSDVLDETLRLWDQTDWPGKPIVVMDRIGGADPCASLTANALVLLREFLTSRAKYLLFLEDDLDFNLHLWSNLQKWGRLWNGELVLGDLYHPAASADRFAEDPESLGGSQALLIRRDAVSKVIADWDLFPTLMSDLRIFRVLGREGIKLHCHSPGLVQHRSVPSTWGGAAHESPEFDRLWRR